MVLHFRATAGRLSGWREASANLENARMRHRDLSQRALPAICRIPSRTARWRLLNQLACHCNGLTSGASEGTTVAFRASDNTIQMTTIRPSPKHQVSCNTRSSKYGGDQKVA